MAKSNVGEIVAKATAFGVAGWVAENALSDHDRYSALFRGHRVPFLPVYAFGGVAMTFAHRELPGTAPRRCTWAFPRSRLCLIPGSERRSDNGWNPP